MKNKKPTILLAEDEPALGQIIKESLEAKDFNVYLVENGIAALEAFTNHQPDILILDVMMPLKDGFTVAQEIREKDQNTPILFLTAKSQTKDVVTGFNIGGNDYLKKPFSIEELLVRIWALIKKNKKTQNTEENIAIGTYVFNYNKQTLVCNTHEFNLTHREASLLLHLYKQRNNVLDRTFILNKLWGNDDFFNARSMDVFISKLRKKLQHDDAIQIVNVRGFGYKLIC